MSRRVLFTFGNHMHWVDMQWLWGYDVLPGSVDDMLRLCREAGVKGNVNFEGLGYEKMAAEAPNALARLRDAVREGIVEPVGCSYGQPYGLFQGPESNVRQRTFGVRSTLRLLGVRPRSFWEEEFDFFPQLPQILDGCGFTCANLFFQWTWHTPEVPREETSLIRWEGIDGTSLPTLPRNSLNLHQWPEDFDGLFESDLLRGPDLPAIVQWIELMPSRDWMCRSEVLLPRLRELMARDDLRLEAGTMAEVVERLLAEKAGEPATGDGVPVRRYAPDEVWHGMTLGKNGDKHPRASRDAEAAITAAEKIASIAGLFGRPYPRWDVYPTWEIEEAWRELLAAQHHDNHECEGLCGDIGATGFRKAECLAHGVTGRTLDTLVPRIARPGGQMVVFNGQGWSRDIVVQDPADEGFVVVRDVPPFGYRAVDPDSPRWTPADPISIEASRDAITLRRREMEVEVDRGTGRVFTPTSRKGSCRRARACRTSA